MDYGLVGRVYDQYQNDPAMLRSLMSQYGVGVSDVAKAKGMTEEQVALSLNRDGGANNWGGLHFNADGSLYGTDWGGPVAQQKTTQQILDEQRNSPFVVGGGTSQLGPVDATPAPTNVVATVTAPAATKTTATQPSTDFSAVNSFIDDKTGKRIYYDATGRQSLLGFTYVTDQAQADKILADRAAANASSKEAANVTKPYVPPPVSTSTGTNSYDVAGQMGNVNSNTAALFKPSDFLTKSKPRTATVAPTSTPFKSKVAPSIRGGAYDTAPQQANMNQVETYLQRLKRLQAGPTPSTFNLSGS